VGCWFCAYAPADRYLNDAIDAIISLTLKTYRTTYKASAVAVASESGRSAVRDLADAVCQAAKRSAVRPLCCCIRVHVLAGVGNICRVLLDMPFIGSLNAMVVSSRGLLVWQLHQHASPPSLAWMPVDTFTPPPATTTTRGPQLHHQTGPRRAGRAPPPGLHGYL
jgi:hypothetical protein